MERLRAAYDELVDEQLAADGDRLLGGVTRQVMHPSRNHLEFADNEALHLGRELAAGLFVHAGIRQAPVKAFEMLIDKPPGHAYETPWHQDAGYWDRPVLAAGSSIDEPDLQFWFALDDVDVNNGCMQFVATDPGEPSLQHEVTSRRPTLSTAI